MQLEKCVALHPYAMILREKDMDRQDYRELARHIQVMCRKASVKMFVHSDISAAKYADCGNVHFSMEHFKQMCEEQADAKSKELGKIPKGIKVEVVKKGASWTKVKYKKNTGYVATKYLK